MISLGIDIGGTGCKCVAFNEKGTQLALSYREYPLQPGQVNLPPLVMRDAVFGVIRQCADELEDLGSVKVITVSSFGESFVTIDPNGNPVGDILLYFAESTDDGFSQLIESIGREKVMRTCRTLPDAFYSLSKMLYTKRQTAVGQFLFIASYICWCLSGESVCDPSLACRSLLYDVEKGSWSEPLLTAAGIRKSQLPDLSPTGTIIGTLLPEVASELHLNSDVEVLIGAHDQIVNALGAGLQRVGDAVDTSGTCECITPLFAAMPTDMHFHEQNYCCVPYLQSGGYVTYAYNLSAGSVVRWFRDALGAAFAEEAERDGISIYDAFNRHCPEEPTNLMVLPFLQGMGGTPDLKLDATGAILGLTTSTRLPDIYRAILEGITYEMRYNQEQLHLGGIGFQCLHACGGGARSAAWLQVKADILGCGIIPVETEETGAMGSAILGFAATLGESPFDLASRFIRHGSPIRPIPAHQDIYQKKYELYKQLRSSLC